MLYNVEHTFWYTTVNTLKHKHHYRECAGDKSLKNKTEQNWKSHIIKPGVKYKRSLRLYLQYFQHIIKHNLPSK